MSKLRVPGMRPLPILNDQDLGGDTIAELRFAETLVRYADGSAFGVPRALPAVQGDALLDLAVTAMEQRDLGDGGARQLGAATLKLIRDLKATTDALADAELRTAAAEVRFEVALRVLYRILTGRRVPPEGFPSAGEVTP